MTDEHQRIRFRDPGGAFGYDLTEVGLRVSVGAIVLRTVPYRDIERVERGWAPGWQAGALGMPFRGDEVRIRVRTPVGLPWMTVTPDQPDRFAERLVERAGLLAPA